MPRKHTYIFLAITGALLIAVITMVNSNSTLIERQENPHAIDERDFPSESLACGDLVAVTSQVKIKEEWRKTISEKTCLLMAIPEGWRLSERVDGIYPDGYDNGITVFAQNQAGKMDAPVLTIFSLSPSIQGEKLPIIGLTAEEMKKNHSPLKGERHVFYGAPLAQGKDVPLAPFYYFEANDTAYAILTHTITSDDFVAEANRHTLDIINSIASY